MTYHCTTQHHETASCTAAQLGSNGCISRYSVNATLRYFVDLDGFQAKADGEYVAACFEVATQAWSLGPVQFKRSFDRKDAFFSVVYSSDAPNDRTLAAAFFPNCPAESRMVKVFPLAFVFRDAMVNTFCHELGHVLGLRHEFAAQTEKDDPSVHWGFPNPESVMNYYNHPLEMAVHELDIALTNGLYAYEGDSLEGFPIEVVSPTSEPCWT
ncbi:hypothetical protein NW767_008695 [Fusarium falciforme]|nr:hypothetical protein NW767_008695 [Fusarium falciforme]